LKNCSPRQPRLSAPAITIPLWNRGRRGELKFKNEVGFSPGCETDRKRIPFFRKVLSPNSRLLVSEHARARPVGKPQVAVNRAENCVRIPTQGWTSFHVPHNAFYGPKPDNHSFFFDKFRRASRDFDLTKIPNASIEVICVFHRTSKACRSLLLQGSGTTSTSPFCAIQETRPASDGALKDFGGT